jgi:hypothetical protein
MSDGENNILSFLKKTKVFTLTELSDFIPCSKRTAQRKLKQWKTYRSFNFNGRFYVLQNIPEFDENGTWKYRNILFSKHGNLKATFEAVVSQSQAGLHAVEIGKIMKTNAYAFLSHFSRSAAIRKEKHKGIYLYFSDDPEKYREQKSHRNKLIQSKVGADLPPDFLAVIILVEFIKHPQDSVRQLARRVREKKISISENKISNLLIYHDLVKKTSDSQS